MSADILTDEQVGDLYLDWQCFFKDNPGSASLCIRAIEQAVLQSPEAQALRKDAERYRYARENIMEDHELPGSYHLSDEGEYWDKTIDAAMEKQP